MLRYKSKLRTHNVEIKEINGGKYDLLKNEVLIRLLFFLQTLKKSGMTAS